MEHDYSVDDASIEARIWQNEQFLRIKHAEWQQWRELARDKEFVLETARLKYNLSAAFERHPKQIERFFDSTFHPTAAEAVTTSNAVRRIKDKHLQRVLRRYVRYVSRFGVVMRLHKHAPRFRTLLVRADPRVKFHVKVVRSRFEPPHDSSDDGQTHVSEFFGSDNVSAGPELQKLIDSGHAKFVQIEDPNRNSLFTQLMDFAYSPSQLTFVVVASQQPYIFCAVGENVSVEGAWHKAGKVISELQRDHYKRTQAGRPPDMTKLRRQLAVLLRSGKPPKEMAIDLAEDDSARKVYSKMSSLSQLKRKLRI